MSPVSALLRQSRLRDEECARFFLFLSAFPFTEKVAFFTNLLFPVGFCAILSLHPRAIGSELRMELYSQNILVYSSARKKRKVVKK